jgi:hypothetical protein
MATVDEITKEKQRVGEALARVDAQREKLSSQLSELEATERVLARYSSGTQARKYSTGTEARKVTSANPPKVVSNDDLSRALQAARTRGRALVAELLRGKDMLSTEEFGKLLRVTRDSVNEKRKRREVLALEGAGQGPRFPKLQIGKDRKPFRALPELFDRLGGDPWAVYRFLVQHHPELNGLTGVEALQRSQMEQVIDAAESTMRAAS